MISRLIRTWNRTSLFLSHFVDDSLEVSVVSVAEVAVAETDPVPVANLAACLQTEGGDAAAVDQWTRGGRRRRVESLGPRRSRLEAVVLGDLGLSEHWFQGLIKVVVCTTQYTWLPVSGHLLPPVGRSQSLHW